ncbi:MAG: ribonuclease III domain-containing protein [Oscillospiraceae bacterium]
MSDTTFAKRKSPVELAFIGDAVFEVLVREHITRNVDTSANKLHRMAVSYVCAEAQSEALEQIAGDLTAEELDIVRRGKNASKVSVPRNGTPRTYRSSTALEALFGYLYLSGETERIDQLFEKIKSFHTDKE